MTEDQEHADNVRTQLMCALLRTVPASADSGSAAAYVWDTVERIMQFRAKRQGLIPLPVETPKDIAHPEPAPKTPFPTIDPETLPEPTRPTWGSDAKFGEHDDGPY